MIEALGALWCLGFSLFLLVGGVSTRFYERFLARTVEMQHRFYVIGWKPSMATHVKVTRVMLGVAGALGTMFSAAWLVSLAVA